VLATQPLLEWAALRKVPVKHVLGVDNSRTVQYNDDDTPFSFNSLFSACICTKHPLRHVQFCVTRPNIDQICSCIFRKYTSENNIGL
jgi:hypothetical protein